MTTVQLLLHDMDVDQTADAELDAVLNLEERHRADRFNSAVHRRRYRVGRALLRRMLGRWSGVPAAKITLAYGRNGKPEMANGPAFNLSHSEGVLLIGVADHGRLGVDIEVLRPIEDREELAASNFAPDEVRALKLLPTAERNAAFLRVWTRKEAFIKAIGDGLSIPLQSFCVTPAATAGNALRAVDRGVSNFYGIESWSICSVPIAAAAVPVVAAVALDSSECDFKWLPALQ